MSAMFVNFITLTSFVIMMNPAVLISSSCSLLDEPITIHDNCNGEIIRLS